MFIWHPEDEIWVTLQSDHMSQAGDIGAAWGGRSLGEPKDRVAVVTAARNHDEGWRGWELAPDIDARTHLPYDFISLDSKIHTDFYGTGVDFVEPSHPRAALLISKHASGLYRGRYGVDGLPVTALHDLPEHCREFVEFEEARQIRLKEMLSLTDADIWHDYRLLQIWDQMSVFLCNGMGTSILGPVPLEDGSLGPQLALHRVAPLLGRVVPFPFDGDEFSVPVRSFRLSRGEFRSRAEWDEEMARTCAKVVEFRFVK